MVWAHLLFNGVSNKVSEINVSGLVDTDLLDIFIHLFTNTKEVMSVNDPVITSVWFITYSNNPVMEKCKPRCQYYK